MPSLTRQIKQQPFDYPCLFSKSPHPESGGGLRPIWLHLLLVCTGFAAVLPYCQGQMVSTAGGTLLTSVTPAQVETAISGDHAFQSVRLSGMVTRDANPKETVPIEIVVSADGSTSVTIYASSGVLSKTEIPTTADARCNPQGTIRVARDLRDFQCNVITSWILPTLTVAHPHGGRPTIAEFRMTQFGQKPVPVIAMDLYRKGFVRMESGHPISSKAEEHIVYLDPSTKFPISMQYGLFPRDHSRMYVPITISYSDYGLTGGISIPHHIKQIIANHLLLDISIDSVEVN